LNTSTINVKHSATTWYGVAGITSYTYNWENVVFMLNKWLVHM